MGRSFQGTTGFAQTADRSQPSLGSLLIFEVSIEGVDDGLLEMSRSWTSPIVRDAVEDVVKDEKNGQACATVSHVSPGGTSAPGGRGLCLFTKLS